MARAARAASPAGRVADKPGLLGLLGRWRRRGRSDGGRHGIGHRAHGGGRRRRRPGRGPGTPTPAPSVSSTAQGSLPGDRPWRGRRRWSLARRRRRRGWGRRRGRMPGGGRRTHALRPDRYRLRHPGRCRLFLREHRPRVQFQGTQHVGRVSAGRATRPRMAIRILPPARQAAPGSVTINPVSGPNHYAVSAAASAVNCAPTAVTISAHSSTHTVVTTVNTIKLGTSTGHGDWSLTTGAGVFAAVGSNTGIANYTYAASDAGVAVFALRDTYPETVTITVTDGTATATSGTATASEDSPITFAPSGFIVTNGANVRHSSARRLRASPRLKVSRCKPCVPTPTPAHAPRSRAAPRRTSVSPINATTRPPASPARRSP